MSITRRQCLLALPGLATMAALARSAAAAEIIAKKIPSSGEMIPVVGLGSWITFNVGNDRELQDECAEVMRAFFASGGALIDSSPMYGSSQATIGYGLGKLGFPTNLFAADKVWISSPEAGPAQIGQSQRLWGIPRFRLLQVHNLLSWEQHLSTLFEMKKAGQLNYLGITTSEGRRRGEVEKIMNKYAFSLQGLALIAGCLAWPQCGNEGSPGLAAPLFAVATTVLYPLVNLIGGQDVLTAETFGLMPTPTAVATFGLLGVVHNRAFATVLAIIPLLWCLTIAATLNAMNLTTWLVPALLAATGAALATVPRHRCLKQWVRR